MGMAIAAAASERHAEMDGPVGTRARGAERGFRRDEQWAKRMSQYSRGGYGPSGETARRCGIKGTHRSRRNNSLPARGWSAAHELQKARGVDM
jgi:hypothetical protein